MSCPAVIIRPPGVSPTPRDASLAQHLPPFDADKITGDELIDFLQAQRRTIRKWQFIDMQSRLAGRRLTFHKLRLSGSIGELRRNADKFWIGAVARWEAAGEGDLPGRAKFKLSFKDDITRQFAAHLVSQIMHGSNFQNDALLYNYYTIHNYHIPLKKCLPNSICTLLLLSLLSIDRQ